MLLLLLLLLLLAVAGSLVMRAGCGCDEGSSEVESLLCIYDFGMNVGEIGMK